MKTIGFKHLFIFTCLFLFIGVGCEKDDELPSYHAKGTIIEITGGCYGEIVIIDVEEPQGIGLPFTVLGEEDEIITYQNAIGVPYFAKIGIPNSIPQAVGIRLNFEYRELTEDEEEQSHLFSTDPPIICPHNIAPPVVKRLIIKKVVSYE
ncbi:hypothetical protein GCQ56_04625 [Marinifilum sp. N1E240]|uniref:hypothetical protein n=1 Tax=Marinifilum sp. N1E240 TaxID=2608082 RepID=UPI00128BC601|nr:hypothetical protein [Marinifilum sp. N1E240]MPQ46285.1 hypothetical protein [Marinifilum sp. N1E240]